MIFIPSPPHSSGKLEKDRYSKVREPQRLGKVVISICLLIATAFLVTWKLPATAGHADRGIKGNQYTALNAFLSGGVGNFFRNPLSPKEISLMLESIAEPEDDLQIAGFDFDCHTAYLIAIPEYVSPDKILSALPTLFSLNRTVVPLFVLHHSWKNFLP